jgi:hypothetical protein
VRTSGGLLQPQAKIRKTSVDKYRIGGERIADGPDYRTLKAIRVLFISAEGLRAPAVAREPLKNLHS